MTLQCAKQRPALREVIHVICWHFVQVVVSRFGNTEPHVNFLLDTLPISSQVAVLSPQNASASLLLVTGNKVRNHSGVEHFRWETGKIFPTSARL